MAHHAKLSPSSAHRWMNCAGSVHLIGDEPNSAGHAAMLGTAVHKIVETMIDNGETDASQYLKAVVFVHKPGRDETQIHEPGTTLRKVMMDDGWYVFTMGDTEVDGAQMMIDEVERVKGELFECELFSERFLDMTWLDSRLGGTADVTLLELGGYIHLFDYKNGRVIVEVDDNEQFLNYAVGLLHEHPNALGVHIHLVQPNGAHELGPIRDKCYEADEIRLFELKMKAAAEATTPKNAKLRAGAWCTYCPANSRCKEFDNLAQANAGFDFADDPPDEPPALTDTAIEADPDSDEVYRAELARKFAFIPILDGFIRNVRAAVQAELVAGRAVGELKLVNGRANRKWSKDDDTIAGVLMNKWGVPEDDLYDRKLKGPAKIEKLKLPNKDKKAVKAIVESLAIKPLGKVSVALGTDPRPAIDSAALAAADFADDEPEGDDE